MKALDLTGQRFGLLTVLNEAPKRTNGNRQWKCKCDCGGDATTGTGNLRSGMTKSCGCLRVIQCRETGKACGPKYPKAEAGFRELLRVYRRAAKERGLAFELSKEEFRALTKQNCSYCDAPPSKFKYSSCKTSETKEFGKYLYNGVDRKDSSKGYLLDNCVTACTDCNLAKQSLTHEQFLDLVTRIYHHSIKD